MIYGRKLRILKCGPDTIIFFWMKRNYICNTRLFDEKQEGVGENGGCYEKSLSKCFVAFVGVWC